MKNITKYILLGTVSSMLLTSCATTSQFMQLEQRQANTESKVQEFENKFQEVLNENNLLREKLANQVPITYVESNGILFEVMKVYREGNQTIVEFAMTNRSNENLTLQIQSLKVTVTDEVGTPAKVMGFRYQGDSKIQYNVYQQLVSNSPYRFELILENLKPTAEGLGLIGMEQVTNVTRNVKFDVVMKHVNI